jgi:HEAT repeat protein
MRKPLALVIGALTVALAAGLVFLRRQPAGPERVEKPATSSPRSEKEPAENASLPGVVSRLLEEMATSDDPSTGAAADRLAALGNRALPPLIDALARDSDEIRVAALAGIRRLVQEPWDQLAFEDGVLRLPDPDLDVAVEPVARALDDPSLPVQVQAAITLGKMGARAAAAVPALQESLSTSALPLRVASVAALGKIGPAAANATSTIARCLDHEARELREVAAIALGRIGPDAVSAVPALVAALADPEGEVRRWAAAALGKIGNAASAAVPALARALSDPYHEVRYMAANSLARMQEDAVPAVADLARGLGDEELRVRRRMAMALGLIGEPAAAAAPALLALLDGDGEARGEAAWALGRMPVAALPALLERLDSDDESLRKAAAQAIVAAAPASPERALPVLLRHLGDSSADVALLVEDALVLLGDAARPSLEEIGPATGPDARKRARNALLRIQRRKESE